MANKKELLTIKEAELKYRIGRNTLYSLYEDGLIKGYKPGKKKIFLYKDSIEKYLLGKSNIN